MEMRQNSEKSFTLLTFTGVFMENYRFAHVRHFNFHFTLVFMSWYTYMHVLFQIIRRATCIDRMLSAGKAVVSKCGD